MNSPHDIFMHEMGDIYNVEQMIAQILPVLTQESQDQQAQQAYQTHLQEMQRHIQNLEQCFKLLGNAPPSVTCYAVAGLKQEQAMLQCVTQLSHQLGQQAAQSMK